MPQHRLICVHCLTLPHRSAFVNSKSKIDPLKMNSMPFLVAPGALMPFCEVGGDKSRVASTKTLYKPLTGSKTLLNGKYDLMYNFDVVSAIAVVFTKNAPSNPPKLHVSCLDAPLHFEPLPGNVWRLPCFDGGDLSAIHFACVGPSIAQCTVEVSRGGDDEGEDEGEDEGDAEAEGLIVVLGAILHDAARAQLVSEVLCEEAKPCTWTILDGGKVLDKAGSLPPLALADSPRPMYLLSSVETDAIQFPGTFDAPFTLHYGEYPRLYIVPALAQCIRAGAFGVYDPAADVCTLHLGCVHCFPAGKLAE